MHTTIGHRRVAFEFHEDSPVLWNQQLPEFSIAANAISLLMPAVEPAVIRSLRHVQDDLSPDLSTEVAEFCRQEMEHQRQHRRFNQLLLGKYPRLRTVMKAATWWYGRIGRGKNPHGDVAFTAASEALAFSMARWSEEHLTTLFDPADPQVATMFLWHLAEEVEHKSVAHDVRRELNVSSFQYLRSALMMIVALSVFTLASIFVMMVGERKAFSPISWFRVVRWGVSLSFTVLADLAASCMKSHDPRVMADPPVLSMWLSCFDPATSTMPLWGVDRAV